MFQAASKVSSVVGLVESTRPTTEETLDAAWNVSRKQEIEQQDSTFPEEVNTLLRVQDNFTKFCLQMCGDLAKVNKPNTKLLRESMKTYQTIPASKFNEAFNVTYADCTLLQINEIEAKKGT